MCIAVFIWKAHPIYPFLLLLNRDEYYNRPTQPLAWWPDAQILGGRDGLAAGTWLSCSRNGRVAFLTNVRELPFSLPHYQPKSRGHLPVRFLQSKKTPKEFAAELGEEADHYNGFNLIVADLGSMTMLYLTRPMGDSITSTHVSPGVHVLSNAKLETPWPTVVRDLLDKYEEGEIPLKEMSEKLMRDATKDDNESKLPQIYPPEWEYHLSSIFVDAQTRNGRYGTRSTSVLAMITSVNVTFYEMHLEEDSWKEEKVSFFIEK